MIAVLAIPAVILLGWVLYSDNVALRDGKYTCEPVIPGPGMFWTATVQNGQLVAMRWDGPGRNKVTDFGLGPNDGAESFSASANGRTVTCEFWE